MPDDPNKTPPANSFARQDGRDMGGGVPVFLADGSPAVLDDGEELPDGASYAYVTLPGGVPTWSDTGPGTANAVLLGDRPILFPA